MADVLKFVHPLLKKARVIPDSILSKPIAKGVMRLANDAADKIDPKILKKARRAQRLHKKGKLTAPVHLSTLEVRVHLSGPGASRTQDEIMRDLDNKGKL